MPETSVSTRQLSEDFDDVDGKHTANNDIPPLPKKMQPRSILSKTKMADLTRGNAENAGSDPSQTEDMTEQAGSGVFEMTRLKVFCTDIPNYGYLTPTDPPTYNEFHERGTAPAGCSTTDKIVLRVDSAIGPEPARGPGNAYSSTPPPVSPASLLSAARLSAQYNLPYEDIDHYTLIHEDGNRSSDRHQWPSTISGGPDDVSHAYLQFSTHKFPDSSQRFTRQRGAECWIVVSLIVILVVSMTALSLSVYQLVSPSSKPAQISQNLKQTLINMEWTLDNLITETEALKGAMRTQVTDLTFLTEDKIVPVTSQLKNLSLMIESTNDKFAAQIANTSLTPGPQGPPGAVNLSLCLRQSLSHLAPASATATTETSLLPSLVDIQKYFVTFAYCTYSGASDVNLGAQWDNTTQRQRYRCTCRGQVSGVNRTVCSVFVWMCPQE